MTFRRANTLRTPFLKIGLFGRDLPSEITRFESAIIDKFTSDDAQAFGPFTVTDKKTADYRAKFWEVVRVDPTSGALTMLVPTPDDQTAGWIVVVNDSASAHNVTLRVAESGYTVQRASSFTLGTANGTAILIPDRTSLNWTVLAMCDPSSPVTFGSTTSHNDDSTWLNRNAIFKDAGGTTVGFMGTGFGFAWTLPAAFSGTLGLSGIVTLSGAGRIRKRVVYATDANATYDVATADVVVCKSGTVTATRVLTLADGAEGETIELHNYTGFAQTIHNSGGASLLCGPASVPAFASPIPGIVRLTWLTNGAYTGWSGA